MKIQNIEDYLKDAKGNKSSSRLFSYYLLKFFFWFVSLTLVLGSLMIWIMKDSLDASTIATLGLVWLVFIVILGIMIFAPKQLGKIQEIKELIEIAKK